MFALFRAQVRIVDAGKRAILSRQLLAEVSSNNDIHTLESNLSNISIGSTTSCKLHEHRLTVMNDY